MTDDRDILIARYLDGAATPDEVERLERHLSADPSAAAELYKAAFYEVLLRDAFVSGAATSADEPAPTIRLPVAPATAVAPPGAARRTFPAAVEAETSAAWGRRPWWFAATAACLLVALTVGFVVLRNGGNPPTNVAQNTDPQGPAARVSVTGGGVTVQGAAGPRGVAGGTVALAADEQVQTPAGSSATIAFDGEDTRVTIAPSSTVRVGANKRFTLVAGRLDCTVARQDPKRPLVVATAQGQLTVVGTRFTVTTQQGWTRLHVTEGTVRARRSVDQATVDVSADEYVDIGAPNATAAAGWAPPKGARDMAAIWSPEVRPAGINQ